jgi:hypothetical protein
MKMKTLLIAFALVLTGMTMKSQNDTIIGFDFSDTTKTTFTANYGLSGNLTYDLRAEDSVGTTRTLTYTNGATNFAATATGWDNGAMDKCWSVKFKANGFTGIKVSAKLSSGGNKPGPKYWKIQARKSGGTWVDLTPDTLIIANDWTTGVITDLALPASFDNPGTTSVYIRWIMISNESATGNTVLSDGICKIDDILVTGTSPVGIETTLFGTTARIFPNPATDFIHVIAPFAVDEITLIDTKGNLAVSTVGDGNEANCDLRQLSPGMYLLSIREKGGERVITRKIMIQ